MPHTVDRYNSTSTVVQMAATSFWEITVPLVVMKKFPYQKSSSHQKCRSWFRKESSLEEESILVYLARPDLAHSYNSMITVPIMLDQ